jgi:RNA polymerase sigma-70 factor, ECF subfamily
MTPADRHEDLLLRQAILAGQANAWERLYDRERSALEAYVLWRCGRSRVLAEDAIQEVWLAALKGIRAFDPARATLRTWLRGIAGNVVQSRLRSQQRWLRLLQRVASPAESREAPDALRIAQALAELPPRYVAVLRGKYLDGWSVARLATELGETQKAVESLLTRARAAFRERHPQPPENVS